MFCKLLLYCARRVLVRTETRCETLFDLDLYLLMVPEPLSPYSYESGLWNFFPKSILCFFYHLDNYI